jgi:CheY-like chemotaxis protein
VTLRLALDSGLPGIEADRGQLQQVIMNLVINAAEAIGDRAGTVVVTTRAQEVTGTGAMLDEVTGKALKPGTYVCFEVRDTGCGMSKETRDKIFDPFFTTKFMGRGLGLAAVAGIVQAARGAIQLTTSAGTGTTFRAFLPAAAGAVAGAEGEEDLRGCASILVVDDEAMVLDFTRSALERCGYQVLLAGNGRDAIRIFADHAAEVSLVLLDLMMPVMGGDEAIVALKARRPDVPVVVMSGYSEHEALRMFAGRGVAGFLQKPFTATRLAQEVRLALEPVRE